MISGPSKKKLICAGSSQKLIIAAVNSRVVSVEVFQFAKESSINKLLDGFSESCQKSMKSKFKFELNCGEQKTIILELDIVNSELRTEFCLFQYCRSRVN